MSVPMLTLVLLAGCAPEPATNRSLHAEQLARVDQAFIQHVVTLPLEGEALVNDPVIGADATTASAAVLFEVFAYCALSHEDALVVDGQTFPGWLGGWPSWAEEPCGEECQEAVSGCILAKTNVYGIQVDLVFLADIYPEAGEELMATYPIQEGAFFGNWFVFPQKLYACVGDGIDPLHRAFRTCSHAGNGCHIQHVGSCGGFDGSRAQATEGQVCEGIDDEHGYYIGCYDRPSDANGDFPADAKMYRHATTVNIRDSRIGSPEDETCFAP